MYQKLLTQSTYSSFLRVVKSTEYGSDFLLLTGDDRVLFKVEDKATNLALLKSRWKPTNLFVILTTTFIITWTPTFGRPIVQRFSVYSLFLNFSNFKLFIYSRKISLLSEWTSESPLMLSSDYICSKFNAELKWSQLLAKAHILSACTTLNCSSMHLKCSFKVWTDDSVKVLKF